MLGLWLGNQDTSGDILNELYTKIKLKFAFWKGRNLSLIGRVMIINIFILSDYGIEQKFFCTKESIDRN